MTGSNNMAHACNLTKAQALALFHFRNDDLVSRQDVRLPNGRRPSWITVQTLIERGLLLSPGNTARRRWTVTAAGRAALAAMNLSPGDAT